MHSALASIATCRELLPWGIQLCRRDGRCQLALARAIAPRGLALGAAFEPEARLIVLIRRGKIKHGNIY